MMAEAIKPDLEPVLRNRIDARTGGRVHQLRVEVTPTGVAVRGFTSSYYCKQLALCAVQEVLGTEVPIYIFIEVGGSLFTPSEGRDSRSLHL